MPPTIVAETLVRSDVATVRHLAQTPEAHVRWDVRFTGIDHLHRPEQGAPQRFRYSTRLGFGLAIEGWGETVASKNGDGSALRFGSDDPGSLIAEGAGTWTYAEEGDHVRFRTVYDYRPRHGWGGRLADRVAFRPLMTWATRWSFDRLRLWVEQGLAPETTMRLWLLKRACLALLGAVWILSGLVPKLISVRASEVALVTSSGLAFGAPLLTLQLLGVAEILAGVWLLTGLAERAAVVTTTLAMVGLAGLVALLDPAAVSDPYGGLVKNLGLVGCALAVLVLSPLTPKSSRGRPRGG